MMKKIQKIGKPKLNKKTAVMAVAAVTAAAIAATGIYSLGGRVQEMDVYAKESFTGMKEIVEEHDKDHPFRILDITPTKAMYIVSGANAKTYNLSTGTIGYLTGGQAPIEKDIYDIFHDNTNFYKYEEREALAKAIIPSGYHDADFLTIEYEEAYGGTVDRLDESRDWIKLYDSVLADGPLADDAAPTGQLMAYVTPITDEDREAGKYGEYKLVNGNVTAGLDEEGLEEDIYKFNQDSGEWYLTFAYDPDAVIGYVPSMIYCDDLSSCSNTTGVYYKEDDGTYTYVGTKADVLHLPKEDKKPSGEDKDKPGEGKEPGKDTENTEGGGKTDTEGEGGGNTDTEGDAGDKTDTGADNSGTGGDNSGTGADNSGTGGDNSGTGADNSGTGGDNSGTGADNSGTGGDNSGTGADNSSTSGDNSGTGADKISSGSEKGSSTESTSSSASGADETAAADAVWRLLVEDGESDEAEEERQVQDSDSEDGDDANTNDSDIEEDEEEPKSQNAGSEYYVLEFTFVTDPAEDTMLYRITDKTEMSEWDSEIIPLDRYDLDDSFAGVTEGEEGIEADEETDADAVLYASGSSSLPEFEYVGKEEGEYSLQKAYASDDNYADAKEVAVKNAPVYFRCCKGNNWLEKYVFNALEDQDNYYDQFAIEVNCVSADEVSVEDVQEADLIYLEHGYSIFINSDAATQTIGPGEGNGGLPDMDKDVALAIVNRAVTELLPIIVDYDIISTPGQYKDTNYYNLARVFLKEDLTGFYENTGEEDKLSDLFNGLDSDDFEDNTDNECHYVNRNIYMVSGNTPLVSDDFPKSFGGDEAKRGFREVLIAIRAENTMLQEEDWLEEEVSKARAVAYIINYSVGMIGDYRDVSILELQPTANYEPDLHVDNNEDRKTTTLFWQKEDSGESGQQIFRSTKIVDVDIAVKSVAEFNGEWADINSAYDMVFIGLDGQLLNRDGRDQHTVYNDVDLNGLVYHTGDQAAGKDARYDASDITAQKKEALLDYLRAGYPVVVENNCINVRKSNGEQYRSVNTRYIADDTQMYAFLDEALEHYGDYLYTVRDVRGNPEFRAQLNVVKPRITYQDSEQASLVQSLERTEDGKYEGTILYRITGNQEQKNDGGEENGEIDNSYYGDTSLRLYLDLNYDGFFAPSEEMYPTGETGGYAAADGQVTVSFEGVESGIVPWKLEVSDANNGYRRDAMMGYFTIQGQVQLPVKVLQVMDDTTKQNANLQRQFEKIENSTLGRYLETAENTLNVKYEFKTITTGELEQLVNDGNNGNGGNDGKHGSNGNYLNQWDVLVLGFGSSGSLGAAKDAVETYIREGRSVLISYAGAAEDTGRLGLDMSLLGQTNDMTYSKLGRDGGGYYRYKGLDSDMFADPLSALQAEKINEGSITCYPFEVGSEQGSVFFSDVTLLKAPEYLLDFANNTEESEVYVTGWYTLNDNSPDGGGYRFSPRDARNNYYIYSKANVVYVGQNEYPYSYDKDAGEEPKDGVDECKLFVNALTAAYNAGIHNPKVDIVAGFGSTATSVESIPIPFDQEYKTDADGGILDETVDVYFKFVDNNIAFDKVTNISFHYENGTNPDAAFIRKDGSINTADFTVFGSPIWMVENNRLVEVTDGNLRQGVVYRIKAPVVALKGNEAEVSRIFIALETTYKKGGKEQRAIGTDSIALTRAQMFLLE